MTGGGDHRASPAHPGGGCASGHDTAIAARSDDAEFACLYRSTRSELERFLRRRSDAQSAEELTSEVYLTLWTTWERIPPDHASRRGWLFGIAKVLLLRHHRRSARERRLMLLLASEPERFDRDPADMTTEGSVVTEMLNSSHHPNAWSSSPTSCTDSIKAPSRKSSGARRRRSRAGSTVHATASQVCLRASGARPVSPEPPDNVASGQLTKARK